MSTDLDIAIIADDLTGAADTGIQFCPHVGPVYMTSSAHEISLSFAAKSYGGLAVFTNTRNVNPAQAADTVFRAGTLVQRRVPTLLYKKIDSCLRGNVGAEIDAMLMATGAPVSFIAPAFPQQGRTTINDCHMINGVPVSETEISRDPLTPVNQSRLSVLLASQSYLSIGHVSIEYLDNGANVLFERVQKLQAQGCRHIVFDIGEVTHLDAVARLALDRSGNVLLAGSAGLAGSLAGIMPRKQVPESPLSQFRPNRWMFVCGSASQVLTNQSAMLERATGWPRINLDPDVLTAEKTAVKQKTILTDLTRAWRAGSLIIRIAQNPDTDSAVKPEKLMRGLADVVLSLLQVVTPDALFLSGGDTAEAILRQAESSAVLLRQQTLPGLMRGEIIGGLLDGQHVFTKAGSFGNQDTLTVLINSFT